MKITRYISALVVAIVCVAQSANAEVLSVKVNASPDGSYAVSALDYTQITSMATTAKGRLWTSLLCGGDDAEGFLSLAYSDSKGASWKEPHLVLDARSEKHAVRNGVLWLSPKGEMWLFYTVFDGYFDGRGSMWAVVCAEPDAKEPKWGEPRYLGVGVATAQPVVNRAGEWVLPVALWSREVIGYDRYPFIANKWNKPRYASPYVDKYKELDSKRGAGTLISKDGGLSWADNHGKVTPREVVKHRYNNPALFVDKAGGLRMVVRSSATTWSFSSHSEDGVKWSECQKFVGAPDQNFALMRLVDGRLLMVRNGRFDQYLHWRPEGLYGYLSDDDGETWYGGLRVDTRIGAVNPAVAQAKDGTIYIAYQYDPEGKSEVALVTTSVEEIDAATADYKNNPKTKRLVLTGGRAAERAAAELEVLTAPKKKFASKSIRIATYNIQYPVAKPSWKERIPSLVALINEYKFDVFGAQEPYLFQIEDIMEHIGDEYKWIGSNITGDDTDRGHHFNPIFYRPSRVEPLEYDTIWLSDWTATPGYGAYSARLFTWVKFRDKVTKKIFYIFNGHYDHRGIEARINASYVVLDMVRRIAKGAPAFITADYNSHEKSEAYRVLQESGIVADTMTAVEEPQNAQYQSHASYKPVQNKAANSLHIDHIFYTPHAVKILYWENIVKDYNGEYGSDHLPIVIDCKIAN